MGIVQRGYNSQVPTICEIYIKIWWSDFGKIGFEHLESNYADHSDLGRLADVPTY